MEPPIDNPAAGNTVTTDKQAELLMDHYKDTFQLTLEHWKTRNRLFVFVLVTLTLMLFQLTSPNVLEQLANNYIRKQTEVTPSSEPVNRKIAQPVTSGAPSPSPVGSPFAKQQEEKKDLVDFRFITSILWFVLAYLLVQYYQRSILVDRQYIYLDNLEKQINKLMENDYVTREGAFYSQDRPKYLNRVAYLYQGVFLSLSALVIVSKLIQEWTSVCQERTALGKSGLAAPLIFTFTDTGIAIVIGYSTWLYVQWLRTET